MASDASRPLPGGARAVLFDLDGTLVDSIGDLTLATDRTLHLLSLPSPGEARVRTWVGQGLERLLEQALRWALGPAASDPARWTQTWATAWPQFLAQYARANGETVRPLAGADALLERLTTLGLPLGLVTNKARPFTVPLVERAGWAGAFASIVCGDDAAAKKPAPDSLLQAAREIGAPPERAVMIGDSDNDVLAARAAGMWVARVSGGYGPPGRQATADLEDTSLIALLGLFD